MQGCPRSSKAPTFSQLTPSPIHHHEPLLQTLNSAVSFFDTQRVGRLPDNNIPWRGSECPLRAPRHAALALCRLGRFCTPAPAPPYQLAGRRVGPLLVRFCCYVPLMGLQPTGHAPP